MINVIIPTYRPKEYLLECLSSLEYQSLAREYYKIIVILNGEKYPYLTNIQNWISEFKSNIEVYYTSESGVSNARNLGLDYCDGEYVVFIDDDDFVSVNYLESLLSSIQRLPKGAICCSNVKTYDINGKQGEDYLSHAYYTAYKSRKDLNLFNMRKFFSTCWGKIIPIALIGNKRFNPDFKLGEDSLFMANISDRITYIGLSDNDTVYYRRLREGSASRSKERLLMNLFRKCRLLRAYSELYLKKIHRYDFLFFVSRIIAVMKN